MEFMYEGDTVPPIDWPDVLKATVDKAIMEERERCANIVDDYPGTAMTYMILDDLAARIRGTS